MVNQPEIQPVPFAHPEHRPGLSPVKGSELTERPSEREASPILPTAESAPMAETPQEAVPVTQEESAISKAVGGLRHMLGQTKNPPPPIPIVRDELMLRVEKIMEEDLADAFTSLPPVRKQEFKIKGERTAAQIRELLNKTHVKIKKIFKLILEWLMLLPGINKFYLEQEAKIKADKILALKKMTDGGRK